MKTTAKALLATLLLSSTSALSMPCDVSSEIIRCQSASGKYKFTAMFCGLGWSLRRTSLEISGTEVTANVVTAWTGRIANVFQMNIPQEDDSVERFERKIFIETNAKTGKGTVVDTSPGPSDSTEEAITCKFE